MVEQVDRDFREWIVTVEQADAIAAGDSEALYKFYTDNYERLESMARKYARRVNASLGNEVYVISDMMSCLYIDLPHLNWQNALTLTCDIIKVSFHWSASGGYTMRKEQGLHTSMQVGRNGKKQMIYRSSMIDTAFNFLSINETIPGTEDDLTYEEMLHAPRSYEVDFDPYNEYGKSANEIVEMLRDILTPTLCNVLRGMLCGYRGSQLAEFTGITVKNAVGYTKVVKRRLILNYNEVLRRLQASGVEVPKYLLGIVPDGYEAALKYTEMRRNSGRERVRRSRSKASGYQDKRTKEDRHAEYLRRKERQQKAREAAQATAEQTPVTSGLA